MNQAKPQIRLFAPGDYAEGQPLPLSSTQSHYLTNVMRLTEGDRVCVFNGAQGEWLARIAQMHKKHALVMLESKLAEHLPSPDLWLACAAIRNKTDLVVEKATELGVSKIVVVFTQHGVVKSVNMEKLEAHAIEAAEQCERHDVPVIDICKDLPALLGNWPEGRTLLYGDESGGGTPLAALLQGLPKGKYGVLIGPEGGFSALEHQALRAAPFAKAFGMGPRILRADTAAVAALACLQSQLGDWQEKPHFRSAS